jgi:hypothetical protein
MLRETANYRIIMVRNTDNSTLLQGEYAFGKE